MASDVQSDKQGGKVAVAAVHQNILDAVKKAFPMFKTIEDYTSLAVKPAEGAVNAPCPVPAFVLSMPSFVRGKDTDAGLLAVDLHFEARIIGAYAGAGKERKTRELAAAVALFIEGNKFGLKMKGAKFVESGSDSSLSALANHSPWLIKFQVSICLGPSSEEKFIMPHAVYVSSSPEIGLKHLDKYKLVYEREAE
ncbi:hypothetical protein [Halodesulfovibrio marinisediminis]|uniref:Uncharacterized protein n=1 Tax=Halodesulfovibrio marinisediminis DSM 17456 TaxID=1121457 RepID=A0A1N6I1G9_9BACT|nr:hypothetical protein [Halodesulfovibrio marinisediminis]SIO25857.1 hypothetical protein SAMN02745161_2340 [Halodesulfovibrio marinisediminis DSM 17456]